MKILHVISSLEIGGAQRLLSDLLPILAKTEEVSLLVYENVENSFTKKIRDAGVRILSMENHNFYNPMIIFKMKKIFKDYDVVHVHLFPAVWWASLAARGMKVRMVYTEHSTSNSRRGMWFLRAFEQFIYSRYDKIISISKQTQDALVRWLKSNDNRFTVINNGVDVAYFANIKVPIIPNSLIMVSRFVAAKDQETVIRAMTMIDNTAILRFVGDGENRIHCENIVEKLGLADRIQFLGSRADVAELIASSYIGIQSSKWEGFGLTAVEIMACGKPVIGTSVEGLKQVIGGAGEEFSIGDVHELAMKVNALLNNKEHYCKIAEQCRSRAYEYDVHRTADGYLRQYKMINY